MNPEADTINLTLNASTWEMVVAHLQEITPYTVNCLPERLQRFIAQKPDAPAYGVELSLNDAWRVFQALRQVDWTSR